MFIFHLIGNVDGFGIERVDVKQESGENILQSLQVKGTDDPIDDYCTAEDINFAGYKDLKLISWGDYFSYEFPDLILLNL